jgi:hypothetical protein
MSPSALPWRSAFSIRRKARFWRGYRPPKKTVKAKNRSTVQKTGGDGATFKALMARSATEAHFSSISDVEVLHV